MKSIKFLLIAVLVIVGFGANAQWTDGGTYSTTTDAISIGTATAPATGSMLNVYNSTASSLIQVEGPYTGTSSTNRNIGVLQLKNSSTGDLMFIGLRRKSGVHEMVQSVYDATATAWREFTYYNFGTRKYEMRAGILDAEFKNAGNFLINNTGSVGIGTGTTTIPATAKLAVNGKVLATEVQVALVANWADYVFNDDYELKTLDEVESFIANNKHLPGVPSAKEVNENGVNLGEMDAILLKKIEELTLYMIELKKENSLLKEKLEKLD
jgi:hypothetical protein